MRPGIELRRLRYQIAARVLGGLLANPNCSEELWHSPTALAKRVQWITDAVTKELEDTNPYRAGKPK
jgi:hypothetical protein